MRSNAQSKGPSNNVSNQQIEELTNQVINFLIKFINIIKKWYFLGHGYENKSRRTREGARFLL